MCFSYNFLLQLFHITALTPFLHSLICLSVSPSLSAFSQFPAASLYMFFIKYFTPCFFVLSSAPAESCRAGQLLCLTLFFSWFLLNNGEKLLLIYNWFHSSVACAAKGVRGPFHPCTSPPLPDDAGTHKEQAAVMYTYESLYQHAWSSSVYAVYLSEQSISCFFFASWHLVLEKLPEVCIFMCLCEYTFTM